MERLEPEFLLLVRSCQWNFACVEFPRPEIPTGCDWRRFVALARRHRVQGLVWNALAPTADKIPEEAKSALSSEARTIAATNLGIATECGALHEAFAKAEIPLLFVKGLSIAALAYRSPMLKMGWDIDLLIDPGDLPSAAAILEKAGYSLGLPANIADLGSWHLRSKESVWHRQDSFHVELHTRLADNERLIPGIDVHSPRRRVEIASSISIQTLADHELLTYLAVHGATSAWFRLKWIADFAALLAGRSSESLEQLYKRSKQLGAERSMGQALLVADQLFETLQPNPALRKRLATDRSMTSLCTAALRIMTTGIREPTERRFGTLPIHLTHFLLQPGLGFKLSELRAKIGLLSRRL